MNVLSRISILNTTTLADYSFIVTNGTSANERIVLLVRL